MKEHANEDVEELFNHLETYHRLRNQVRTPTAPSHPTAPPAGNNSFLHHLRN